MATQKIEISNKSSYTGQKDGKWTETIEGSFVTESELKFVHKSYNRIKSFEIGVETCVFDDYKSETILASMTRNFVRKNFEVKKDASLKSSNEYVYLITVPKGTRITEVAGSEYRFIMNGRMKAEKIGTMNTMDIVNDSYNAKRYGSDRVNVWVTKLF